MAWINWDEVLATGVAEIDAQHKEIFARLNSLLKACERGRSRDEVCSVIHFLNNYITDHFQNEEELQRSVNYPALLSHKKDHEQFSEKFRKLESKFNAHGASVNLVIQTGKVLSELLFEHIKEKDRRLAEFLKER